MKVKGKQPMLEIVKKRPNGEIFTTSLLVAEKFGKQHKMVMRKIESLPNDDFRRRNFAPSSYLNNQGKQQPMYELTRDGFSYIAMSFTGKEAHEWKVKFIEAFNRMESHLKNIMKKGWLEQRADAALEYKAMCRTVDEVRKLAGKPTAPHHYSNEARLVNWAITGEFKKLDRGGLSAEDLQILTDLQTLNAVLLGAGHDRDARKQMLEDRSISLRQKLIAA